MTRARKLPRITTRWCRTSYGRFSYGVPPRGYADLAFLQHMISVLKQDGKLGIVLPHGVLFRAGSEGKIRKGILKEDILETVVGLPSKLFYNTGIPASILVVNKSKPEHLKNKVIFIDASQDFKEGKNQNRLEDEHVKKIVDAYDTGDEIDKYMRVVDMAEIKENDFNLNIARYIDTSEEEEPVDLVATLASIKEIEAQEEKIDAQLAGFLKVTGVVVMEQREGYKKTKIGWIPEDWDLIPLRNVSDKIWIGLVTTMTKNYAEGGIPLIRNNNIRENVIERDNIIYLNESFAIEHGSRRLKAGDIVSVHTGDICTSAIIDDELDGAHGFATLNTTANNNIVFNNYLCWYLNSVWAKKQAYAVATGDGRGNLNMKDFVKLKVTVPPLPEQKKIASILTTVDDKISSIEHQIQQTEQLKKGLMEKLLTEGIGHTEFKETKIDGRYRRGGSLKN